MASWNKGIHQWAGKENPRGFLGKHHTKETKIKIGLASKGNKYALGSKGRMGQHHSVETLKKMSEAKKGAKSRFWKGGIMKDKEYVNWLKNRWKKRKKEASGSHTFGEWELLKKQYDYTCPNCDRKEPEIKLSEDHIIPLSRGGSDNIENIQPLCLGCNSKKHTKIIKFNKTIKCNIQIR